MENIFKNTYTLIFMICLIKITCEKLERGNASHVSKNSQNKDYV